MPLRDTVDFDLGAAVQRARRDIQLLSRDLQNAFRLDNVDIGLDQFAQEARTAEQEAARLARVVAGIGDETIRVDLETGDAEAEIRSIVSQIEDASGTIEVDVEVDEEAIEGQFDGIASTLSSKLAGLGIGTLVAKSIGDALERENLEARLEASLGLTGGEAEQLGAVAADQYASGFTGSIEEAFGATGAAARSLRGFGETSAAAIAEATESALGLQRAFDQDVSESVRAAGQLVRNGLAPDFATAFDLITAGFQNGADRGGDLLDTLNQFSSNFATLGLDGPAALELISAGLDAGAFNADTAADAIREFSIRVVDDSERTRAALESIGLSADFGAEFAAGGDQAAEAFDVVLASIAAIEDPVARQTAAVELFGTKAEDVGIALIDSFADAPPLFDDVAGATDRLNESLETTETRLIRLQREAQIAAADGIGAVVDAANAESIQQFTESLEDLGDTSNNAGFLGIGAELRELTDLLQITDSEADIARQSLEDFQSQATDDRIARGSQSFDTYAASLRAAEERTTALNEGTRVLLQNAQFDPLIEDVGALERRLADIEFSQVAFQPILDQQAQDLYLARVAELTPQVAALFGSPFKPVVDDQTFTEYLLQVQGLQDATEDYQLDLLRLEEEIDSEDFEALREIFEEVGEESSQRFAEQLSDAVGSEEFETQLAQVRLIGDASDLQAKLATFLAESAASEIPLSLDLDDSEILNLGNQTFGVDFIAGLDTAAVEEYLETEFGIIINADLDVDDTELQIIAATTLNIDAELNAAPGSLAALTELIAEAFQDGFDLSGIGGLPPQGGPAADVGGVWAQPVWVAERRPEAIIGKHHALDDVETWLRDPRINQWDQIAERILTQQNQPQYTSRQIDYRPIPNGGVDMASAMAPLHAQIRSLTQQVEQLTEHAKRGADVASNNLPNMVAEAQATVGALEDLAAAASKGNRQTPLSRRR